MTLRRKVIPVEFQIKPFVRQMKSPRPPRMAGRCAAILPVRLVAPALRSAALSLLARRPLRLFGWSTLNRRFAFCFFVSRHSEPHLSCFPGAFARAAGVFLFCAARMRRSSCLLLRRFAAPPVFFSFPAPSPRGVGGAPRGAPENGRACEAQPPCQRDTGRPGRRDGACRRSTVAIYGPRDRASRIRQCLGPCRAFPRPAQGQPFGSRGLPMAVAPRFRDATPRSASERLRRRPSRARMGRT